MRPLIRIIYIVLLAIGFAVAAQAATKNKTVEPSYTEAQGGDVYNFYFQKAPGPTTVIQGGAQGGQTVKSESPQEPGVEEEAVEEEEAPASSAASVAKVSEPEKEDEPKLNRELYLGAARHTNEFGEFKGSSIGGSYYFNKYVGLTGELAQANRMNKNSAGQENGTPNVEMTNRPSAVDAALGLIINPIQFEFFGFKLLEIGVMAGGMTNERIFEGERKRVIDGFWGTRVAINFSKQFGLTIDSRLAPGENGFGHESVSLRYRF